ncbi:hypothetical protein CALCODRAFT_552981 [Calocera cornea HHB12733]|uniref:Uncharacterized protein n=1 Tax=Calocera cornea HHB12733 TaxID=1353952 RepID=A0A165JCS1_9BASI|nr:hypothetical protein CALCODRAFT_552981 [Calocera cornea HHB12733]
MYIVSSMETEPLQTSIHLNRRCGNRNMKASLALSENCHSSDMPRVRVIRPSCSNCPPRPSPGICLTLYLTLFDTTAQRDENTGVKETHYHWGYLMIHWDEMAVFSYKLKQPFAPLKWWKYDKPHVYKGGWPERTFPVAHLSYDGDVDRKHITVERTIKSTMPGDSADQEHYKACPCFVWVERIAGTLERKGLIDPSTMVVLEQWSDHISHGEAAGHRGRTAGTPTTAAFTASALTSYELVPLGSPVQVPGYSSFPASPIGPGLPWNGQSVPAPATAPYLYATPARYAYPASARYPYPTVGGSYYPGSDPAYYRTYSAPVEKCVKLEEPEQAVVVKKEDGWVH